AAALNRLHRKNTPCAASLEKLHYACQPGLPSRCSFRKESMMCSLVSGPTRPPPRRLMPLTYVGCYFGPLARHSTFGLELRSLHEPLPVHVTTHTSPKRKCRAGRTIFELAIGKELKFDASHTPFHARAPCNSTLRECPGTTPETSVLLRQPKV